MTASDWFTADESEIRRMAGLLTPRCQRLLAVAMCRALTHAINSTGVQNALQTAEIYADTGKTKAALRRARQAVLTDRVTLLNGPVVPNIAGIDQVLFMVQVAASENAVVGAIPGAIAAFVQLNTSEAEARRRLFPIWNDVVGKPFRPVSFSPEWRTTTAVALARGMYETRDFSAMPILADALQDAGCDNADILNHCRDPQQIHVRGCWVVDGVLGKA